jgi:hypothetical protein
MTKEQHGAQAVVNLLKVILKDVPTEFAAVVSQESWDAHVETTTIALREYLQNDHAFSSILTSTDICDKHGVVNGPGVIAALELMASHATKPGVAAQLNHLAANMRHTFTTLRFIKTSKEADDGP